MDQTPGFDTYVAAPELFYFAPQNRWYLVFQSGPPMYSTNDDPGKPAELDATCSLLREHAGHHHRERRLARLLGDLRRYAVPPLLLRRPRTLVQEHDGHRQFPGGFSDPTMVMEDAEAGRLFEASNVYRIRGSNQYLALVEAYDSTSNWHRYFRSWTASSLDGPWVPLQDSGTAPFAGTTNTTFTGQAWTSDISHGEMIRAGYDQTLTIDPCDLRFLYQGFDPAVDTSNYNAIPWRIGLLTQAP